MGRKSFHTALPLLGFPALRSEGTGTRTLRSNCWLKAIEQTGPSPLVWHTALRAPGGAEGAWALDLLRDVHSDPAPALGTAIQSQIPFARKSPQTGTFSPGLVEGGVGFMETLTGPPGFLGPRRPTSYGLCSPWVPTGGAP